MSGSTYRCLITIFFFFASRRRHTRSDRDWSSDVCSSDLAGVQDGGRAGARDPNRMSPRARAERRQNRPLREVLDDLLGHAREIARRAKEMTPAELDYAQQRLEWLADEVWRGAPGGGAPAGAPAKIPSSGPGCAAVTPPRRPPGWPPPH